MSDYTRAVGVSGRAPHSSPHGSLRSPRRSALSSCRRRSAVQRRALEAELAELAATTETAMWLADLDALEAALP